MPCLRRGGRPRLEFGEQYSKLEDFPMGRFFEKSGLALGTFGSSDSVVFRVILSSMNMGSLPVLSVVQLSSSQFFQYCSRILNS